LTNPKPLQSNYLGVMKSIHASITDEPTSTGPRSGADVGTPEASILQVYEAPGYSTGLWECTPGGWHITDRPNTEIVHIVSGRVRMTDDTDGSSREIGSGDVMVLPKGWSGRWDILETTRKFYVIVE
jgi:uncharacterized cupin superfamily protein